jgi:hypothetical protein
MHISILFELPEETVTRLEQAAAAHGYGGDTDSLLREIIGDWLDREGEPPRGSVRALKRALDEIRMIPGGFRMGEEQSLLETIKAG